MRQLFFILISLFSASICEAQNLDSLYKELDKIIENSEFYIEKKEAKIRSLEQALNESSSVEAQFEYTFRLYTEYRPYDDRKARATLLKGLELAKQSGDKNKENLIYTWLGYQNSLGGFYNDAIEWLNYVDESTLNEEIAPDYYLSCSHTYWEISNYSSYSALKERYAALSEEYKEKYFKIVKKHDSFYYKQMLPQLFYENKIKEAANLCREWDKVTEKGSHDHAIMAYFISDYCKKTHNEKKQLYWLILSAIYDCSNAVMDQAALWNLAHILSKKGDMERAMKYIEYSWKCSSKFGSHIRTWQVSPVLTSINDIFRDEMGKINRNLHILLGTLSLLMFLILIVLVFLYIRNHQLSVMRKSLSNTNKELEKLNEQLNGTNEKMKKVNLQLHDSNRVKDEYIARFLSLCSEYIDKMDSYRLKVNRRLKANQYKELLHMTSSDELRDRETKELFANFDSVFLKLYPTFVESFNNLLKPEFHQELGENSELTTDMRMAALIRLGIDDSAHIAEFMRLSPNTVYNYRARLKSRARGDRNKFEDKLKEIGL